MPREEAMPRYQKGDFVKVEFKDPEETIGEWMWVRVKSSDDERQLLFGVLDNEPVNDSSGRLKPGSEIAVSYDRIREHRKPTEFRST